MLYNMARGESGRIVLEIDPSQKDSLYSALTRDGLTLKDWFLQQTSHYLRNRSHLSLVVAEKSTPYRVRSKSEGASPTKKKWQRREVKGG